MCLFQALFACISIRAALIRLYHTPHAPTHTPPPQPTCATLFLYSMFYTVYRNTLYCLQYRCTVSHARGTEGQSVIYFPPHKKKLFQRKVVAIRHRLRGETSAHAHRDIVGAAHSDSLLSGALSGGCVRYDRTPGGRENEMCRNACMASVCLAFLVYFMA